MKKIWIFTTLMILLGLLFATTQVLASPVTSVDLKKTPNHTPGARATERATQRATEGHGNPHDGEERGKPNDNEGREKSQDRRVHLKGTIEEVDESSLTITLNDGSSTTVALTEDTNIKIPTLGQDGSVSDLQTGMTVVVLAREDDDETLTAESIMVIPGKPVLAHNVGVVTEYEPGESITIEDKNDDTYTYKLTEETIILPEERADQLDVGTRVTIIAPRDVTSLDPTAKGIVVHPTKGDASDEAPDSAEDTEEPAEEPTEPPTP